ncbi:hypothetical protein ASF61_03465 [Duganella sp. Leaf126]|uniref:hypothetical protein n=1 Tax=Duganella sp. Leaf126 TaxID=1736266 RepID=UPI0006F271BC|nr:hypothetical protein [Duganella sp. Leaf126]KQQ47697.1 hypothetical protein ASF61_03465 [Duganella sp. Leaf126]
MITVTHLAPAGAALVIGLVSAALYGGRRQWLNAALVLLAGLALAATLADARLAIPAAAVTIATDDHGTIAGDPLQAIADAAAIDLAGDGLRAAQWQDVPARPLRWTPTGQPTLALDFPRTIALGRMLTVTVRQPQPAGDWRLQLLAENGQLLADSASAAGPGRAAPAAGAEKIVQVPGAAGIMEDVRPGRAASMTGPASTTSAARPINMVGPTEAASVIGPRHSAKAASATESVSAASAAGTTKSVSSASAAGTIETVSSARAASVTGPVATASASKPGRSADAASADSPDAGAGVGNPAQKSVQWLPPVVEAMVLRARVLDAGGKVVAEGPVPVQVTAPAPLHIIGRFNAPSFDASVLNRVLTDGGAVLDWQVALGKSMVRSETARTPITAPNALVVDAAHVERLAPAARAALLAQVRSGVPLLVLGGNAADAALWQRELALPVRPQSPATETADVRRFTLAGTELDLAPAALNPDDAPGGAWSALARDSKARPWAWQRALGQGRVVWLGVADWHRYAISAPRALALWWQAALDAMALAGEAKAGWVLPDPMPLPGLRTEICAQGARPGAVLHIDGLADARLLARTDKADTVCAAVWAPQAGWLTFRSDGLPAGRHYIYAPGDWPAWQRGLRREATAIYAARSTGTTRRASKAATYANNDASRGTINSANNDINNVASKYANRGNINNANNDANNNANNDANKGANNDANKGANNDASKGANNEVSEGAINKASKGTINNASNDDSHLAGSRSLPAAPFAMLCALCLLALWWREQRAHRAHPRPPSAADPVVA